MARAPFQILTIPFFVKEGELRCCIFRRSDMNIWQFVAGGGEEGETPLEAAMRETKEEAGIISEYWMPLDTVSSIAVSCFSEKRRAHWGENTFVIPEYTFALQVEDRTVTISREHIEYAWVTAEDAMELLYYDSNKTALWELTERWKKGYLPWAELKKEV